MTDTLTQAEITQAYLQDLDLTAAMNVEFLQNLYKDRAVWKQTFDDASERKNYASIGYTYNQTLDAFIAPKPFNSWILDEETCKWKAPILKPDDGKRYNWNETTKQWDLDE